MFLPDAHNTSRNLFKLNKTHEKLIMRQNSFVSRGTNNWNSSSNNIVCASSFVMHVFKTVIVLVYINFNLREHAFKDSSRLNVLCFFMAKQI